MADKEFTQICKEILAAAKKISPLAEQAGKLVERIEQEKSKLQAVISEAKEAIKQALQGANEQATQTLSAAQSQAERTANLAKEATEQNAASAKSAQQKAAEILVSIEKLQTQIKATADKVENAGALLAELNSLKEQIKTLLQNGIINDTAQSATQTYSSNLIEQKLETKAGTGYSYSKAEANEKFNNLTQGINTAISAAAAAQNAADSKLGKNDKAADSAKLGGSPASDYASKTEINTLKTNLANKLGKNEQAADSLKLGGLAADKYAKKDDIPATPQAATETKAGIVKLKNSITGSLSDTAVSENAVKEYVSKSAGLGIGQSWQDVTAQRQIGVTYTNTTGKPIQLTIVAYNWADYTIKIGDAYFSWGGGNLGQTSKQTYYGIVPVGAEYSVTSGGSFQWLELR